MEFVALELKLTTHFWLFPGDQEQGALLVCCRALAWLALEPGTSQGGDALSRASQLLIQ